MEQWISLLDYASKKGVSLSTLRRYIKSNKIPFKIEKGRYLLLDQSNHFEVHNPEPNHDDQILIQQLNFDLMKAQEEIAELKMLVALYEENFPKQRLDV